MSQKEEKRERLKKKIPENFRLKKIEPFSRNQICEKKLVKSKTIWRHDFSSNDIFFIVALSYWELID
jgi:hypothetical protein